MISRLQVPLGKIVFQFCFIVNGHPFYMEYHNEERSNEQLGQDGPTEASASIPALRQFT